MIKTSKIDEETASVPSLKKTGETGRVGAFWTLDAGISKGNWCRSNNLKLKTYGV